MQSHNLPEHYKIDIIAAARKATMLSWKALAPYTLLAMLIVVLLMAYPFYLLISDIVQGMKDGTFNEQSFQDEEFMTYLQEERWAGIVLQLSVLGAIGSALANTLFMAFGLKVVWQKIFEDRPGIARMVDKFPVGNNIAQLFLYFVITGAISTAVALLLKGNPILSTLFSVLFSVFMMQLILTATNIVYEGQNFMDAAKKSISLVTPVNGVVYFLVSLGLSIGIALIFVFGFLLLFIIGAIISPYLGAILGLAFGILSTLFIGAFYLSLVAGLYFVKVGPPADDDASDYNQPYDSLIS